MTGVSTIQAFVLIFTVCGGVFSLEDMHGVNISIYKLTVDEFTAMKTEFAVYVSAEATDYCSYNSTTCPGDFRNVNLTTELTNITLQKPDVQITVIVKSPGDDILPSEHTINMLKEKRDNLNAASEQQITSVGEQRFSIKPDNPANWIIISVFTVATIVLLLVVVYLSKHKVNHVDEHYEMMKKDDSAGGEVAA